VALGGRVSARCTRCGRPFAECPCGWPRGLALIAGALAAACAAAELLLGPGWALVVGCLLMAGVVLREVT